MSNNAANEGGYCTQTVTPLWLLWLPTFTTRESAPEAAAAGTAAFTCNTPATVYGASPANIRMAGWPPMATETACCGAGVG